MANQQRRLGFGTPVPSCDLAPPAGYKGLAGFHKYWGKKPTEAWHLLIGKLTSANDVVLDPFLGSGLIAKECTDLQRRFIGFDINPISIELTKLYLCLPEYTELKGALAEIGSNIKSRIDLMYKTADGSIATHFLWEEGKLVDAWTKAGGKRIRLALGEKEIAGIQERFLCKSRGAGNMRLFDNSRINSKESFSLDDLFTSRALRAIDMIKGEIERYDGDLKRALLLILSSSLGQMSRMVFAVSNRGGSRGGGARQCEVGSWVIGYWKPAQHFEINAWNCFENKARRLLNAVKEAGGGRSRPVTGNLSGLLENSCMAHVRVGDSESLLKEIPSDSVKVVLTDPPHGDRIPYLELSEMWNCVIGLESDYDGELVVSNAKKRNKDIASYNGKLTAILQECTRVLAGDGLMAIIFNARSKEHWASIHKLESDTGLRYVGCYSMAYSAGSVVQDSRKGGLKSDYVMLYGKSMADAREAVLTGGFHKIRSWSNEFPESGVAA